MGHSYNRRCSICGAEVAEDDSSYCRKHSDYSNRPDSYDEHCTWCGSRLSEGESGECGSCERSAERIEQEHYDLDQEYRRRNESDTPDYEMRNCRRCGCTTVHRRIYRGSGSLIGFLTNGVLEGRSPTEEFRCSNCGHTQ